MKYYIIQNTTAPYRTSLFNNLFDLGLDIEVLYMCELEKNRTAWKTNFDIMKYPYQVLKGFYTMVGSYNFHWDPQIIRTVMKNPNAQVILGGSWNYLDIIAICLLKRIGLIKNHLIFWSEANYLTVTSRKKNIVKQFFKRFVYNSGDGRFIIPGQMSVNTFNMWGIKVKEFIKLPNVIEEEKFNAFVKEKCDNTLPTAIIPARLEEHLKGQLNFFKAIGIENIKKARFLLLGNGASKPMLEKYIGDNHLENHIILKGDTSMPEVVKAYSCSDFFVLPSFSDPSPLTIVEALCCGLPILVSTYCGNHYEALSEGNNGYGFSPYNHSEVKTAFEKMISERQAWNNMGRKSRYIFEVNFKQDVVLKSFINALTSLS